MTMTLVARAMGKVWRFAGTLASPFPHGGPHAVSHAVSHGVPLRRGRCYERPMTRALILAAGLGTRLRPLTDERPKPLVEVCGRPLVVHALQLLADAGVTEVALNSHWLHPLLPDRLGRVVVVDERRVALCFTHEPVVMGTGGGLRGLARVLPTGDGERVVVANADALIDLDVKGLLASDAHALSTLVLKTVDDPASWGAIGTDAHDRIVTFAGRVPPQGAVVRERMFCGWHLLQPRVLDVLPDVVVEHAGARAGGHAGDHGGDIARVSGPESCINKQGYPRWLTDGARLDAFAHYGFFFDVGSPERLWEANRLMLAGDVALHHLRPFARFVERAPRVFVHPGAHVSPSATLCGPCVVDDGARVDDGATIGPFAVVGPRVVVRAGVTVRHAVVQSGLSGENVVDVDASGVIVGERCRVAWAS
jgi:NDP-sugar pyrophosphorylase family protein